MRFEDVVLRLRRPEDPAWTPAKGPEAAVAAILAPDACGEASVLLIERARHPHDPWSGQIGLPGGRREPSDPDLVHTARRETLEEVGIALPPEAAIARFPPLQARRRTVPIDLWIHPVVFAAESLPPTVLSDEVASALWTRLATLLDPAHAYVHEVPVPGGSRPFPAIRLGPHVLWGLTYRMLADLLGRLGRTFPR